ncbi:MAG: endonuclease III domain-containing protein [Desulfuromonadales bacterium]
MTPPSSNIILQVQQRLHQHFGQLHWWPADHSFEVVVGAILTQNTSWSNVERAIGNLKMASIINPQGLAEIPIHQLEQLIRPAGFFRQKALRLQALAKHLVNEWQGDLANFCGGPLEDARNRLLGHAGIGPETADSILLYAANRPSFVVDAYTMRIFQRIGLLHGKEKYDEVRQLFMRNLPEDPRLFNEYHAQIVSLAKTCCRKNRTFCTECPVNRLCRHARKALVAGQGNDPEATR